MAQGTVRERSEEIAREFQQLDGWMERYKYLVELGDELAGLDPEHRDEEHYVHSCQYDLWLRADYDEDERVLRFAADSDARITRGLAALLIRVLDGQPPDSVAEAELAFLEETGLADQLSSQRENGLNGMVERMRALAEDHREDAEPARGPP